MPRRSAAEATAALAEIEQTRAGFEKERETIIAAARPRRPNRPARTMLAAARQEAAALQAAAKTAIEKERDAAEAGWVERANQLAVEIAQRLVARLNGPAVTDAFLDWLLR